MKRALGLVAVLWASFAFVGASQAYGKPGEGIKVGNLTLSPFVDISVTWDSNVHLTHENEKEDFFLDVIPGIAFVNKTDTTIISGRGWGQFRRYNEETDLDSDSYGERLGGVWGPQERLTLAVNEKFIHLSDYEITPRSVDTLNLTSQNLMLTEDRTERVKRDLFDIGPAAEYHITDKMVVDAGYAYSSVDYKTNGLFDWHENRGVLELRHKVTDKTSGLVLGQYSEQSSDGYPDNSTYWVARGGVLYEATKKTALKASAGVESYDFGNKTPSGDDLNKDIFSFDVAGTWQATEKILVEAMARNGIQPATQYADNTKTVTLASLGASYDVTKTMILSAAGSWRYDDYAGKVVKPGTTDLRWKHRNIYGGRVRLDYKPNAKFYDLYVEGTYEDDETNITDDSENYDQWRVAVGLALRY